MNAALQDPPCILERAWPEPSATQPKGCRRVANPQRRPAQVLRSMPFALSIKASQGSAQRHGQRSQCGAPERVRRWITGTVETTQLDWHRQRGAFGGSQQFTFQTIGDRPLDLGTGGGPYVMAEHYGQVRSNADLRLGGNRSRCRGPLDVAWHSSARGPCCR